MSLENSLAKIPFEGNLMPTSYKIVRNGLHGVSNVVEMKCKTVLLRGLPPSLESDGLILTESELNEAAERYKRYESQITNMDKEVCIVGTVYRRSYITTGSVKKPVELNLIFMYDGSVDRRIGFLFKDTDLKNTIASRVKKLPGTIIRPTFWQKCKIKFVRVVTGFPEED